MRLPCLWYGRPHIGGDNFMGIPAVDGEMRLFLLQFDRGRPRDALC